MKRFSQLVSTIFLIVSVAQTVWTLSSKWWNGKEEEEVHTRFISFLESIIHCCYYEEGRGDFFFYFSSARRFSSPNPIMLISNFQPFDSTIFNGMVEEEEEETSLYGGQENRFLLIPNNFHSGGERDRLKTNSETTREEIDSLSLSPSLALQ